MSTSLLAVKIVFLCAVVITWSMIVFNLILTFGGFAYRRRYYKKKAMAAAVPDELLPKVSVLIPARNEAMVIDKSIRALLAMDYPMDRFEIIVVNDKSTDETERIVSRISREDARVRLLTWPPSPHGSGKAHALNEGLKLCKNPVIAVYDADNAPSRDSLKLLCSAFVEEPGIAAAMGKFRCVNRTRNLLTRMVNIETLSFQWMIQAGRYWFSKFAVLPGTNYIIRKDVVEELRGWDEKAITEDAELSVRMQMHGHHVKFVPDSITWEQEPEKLPVWIKQRTRWVRGNNYVMKKFAATALRFKNPRLSTEFLYMFGLYYLFLASIVSSHLIFFSSLAGLLSLDIPGPFTAVWVSAFVLYVAEIFFVLSYENEDRPVNALVVAAMYFTYCQLWIYVVFKSLWLDVTRKKLGVWDKTIRFKT